MGRVPGCTSTLFSDSERQELIYEIQVTGLDQDENGLKDSIQISHDENLSGSTLIEIYGPNENIVDSFLLDTPDQTIELESFGTYSVAVYLRNSQGELQNYSYFQEGLAREGVSIISGQVTSDIGRELQWTQISLVDSHGTVITSTNTGQSGHYSLEVIVPTDTDGSNITLICGLGDNQQNHTIMKLADQNIINFQLETSNEFLEWLIPIIAIFIVAGLICLAMWGIYSRRKPEIIEPTEEKIEQKIY